MNEDRRYFKGSRDGKAPQKSDPLAGARARYDVVVIGSGLAGLTGANVLARAGRKVAVLEQHYNLGGMATWFKRRGGHVFDISLHGFPVGMKKTCRKYWSPAIAGSIVQLESIRFHNPQFELETDFTEADFTKKLVDGFGVEESSVRAFYEEIGRMDFFDDAGETVAGLFERHFPGRNDIHRLLMEPISYANGSTLDDPAITYGIVFSNFMSRGVFTFSGGTDRLVAEMKEELRRNGVEVFSKVQVDKIRVEGRRAVGIEAHGRFLAADAVLSNANLKTTIEELVGLEHFSPEFAARSRAVRLNNSSCQVYFGIREGESIPFVGDLLFSSTRPTFDSPALCDLHGESRTFSFYYPKTRPGSSRYTIVSSTNANWADWAELDESTYAAEKKRLVEETLQSLEEYVPGVRAKIEHAEAATPKSFAFYTQHRQGASFGTKFEGLRVSLDLPTEIQGLHHAGSVGIIMSGWLGAANYGVITANKIDAFLATLVEATT
ncbi:MAG TPA: FAD-dependent oxidoreductase [Planctomycetota bacterium]|nr:FAD-dependent oxidoreductase [Planctomycetota bacterium]